MTTSRYERRPFGGESDIPRLGELNAGCQAVDQITEPPTLQEVRESLLEPTGDWRREVALWQSGTDLAGSANFWVPPPTDQPSVFFWFVVHPSARASDLPTEIIAWVDERAAALG